MKKLIASLYAFCAVVCIAEPENTPPANLKYIAYITKATSGSFSDEVKYIEKANADRKNHRVRCSWEEIDSLLKALDGLMSSKTKSEAVDAVKAIDSIASKQGPASRIALFRALSKDINSPVVSKEVTKHFDGIVEAAFKEIATVDQEDAIQAGMDILDGYGMWIDVFRDDDIFQWLMNPCPPGWRSATVVAECPLDRKRTAGAVRAAIAVLNAYSKLISAQNSGTAKKALVNLEKAVSQREKVMISKNGKFSPAKGEVLSVNAMIACSYVSLLKNAEKHFEDGKVKKLIADKIATARQKAKASLKSAIKTAESEGGGATGMEEALQSLEDM